MNITQALATSSAYYEDLLIGRVDAQNECDSAMSIQLANAMGFSPLNTSICELEQRTSVSSVGSSGTLNANERSSDDNICQSVADEVNSVRPFVHYSNTKRDAAVFPRRSLLDLILLGSRRFSSAKVRSHPVGRASSSTGRTLHRCLERRIVVDRAAMEQTLALECERDE